MTHPTIPDRWRSSRLGRTPRQVLAALALVLIAVLGTARWLCPDPRGFGTHTQLGLGPCAFRELTGNPCPACGMTTAFSWLARGRMEESWRANPAGALIALLCVALIPWLLTASISGLTRPFRSAEGPLVGVVLAGVALALLSWGWRLSRIFS